MKQELILFFQMYTTASMSWVRKAKVDDLIASLKRKGIYDMFLQEQPKLHELAMMQKSFKKRFR